MTRKLSPKQVKLLCLKSQGLSIKQMGLALGTSECTVKNTLTVVRKKLGANNTAHAVYIFCGVIYERENRYTICRDCPACVNVSSR